MDVYSFKNRNLIRVDINVCVNYITVDTCQADFREDKCREQGTKATVANGYTIFRRASQPDRGTAGEILALMTRDGPLLSTI